MASAMGKQWVAATINVEHPPSKKSYQISYIRSNHKIFVKLMNRIFHVITKNLNQFLVRSFSIS